MATVRVRDRILDAWSALSHKMPLGDAPADRRESTSRGWAPQDWTGEWNRRRLAAYLVLQAYLDNVSRDFLDTTDQADRDERREYGDPALVVDTVRSHVLGDSQEIVVDGADAYDPDLDDPVLEVQTDDDGTETEVPGSDTRDPDDVAANDEARALSQMQDFLRSWAEDVHLGLRLIDVENHAVGLGDGVILMGWSEAKQRPVPTVMDPGCYFPVLPDSLDSYDFPERVHFAWEIPPPPGSDVTLVRRITYQLERLYPSLSPLAEFLPDDEVGLDQMVLPDGAYWQTDVKVDRITGDEYEERYLVRDYPWATEPSEWTCVVTDVTWDLDDLNQATDPDAFDVSKGMPASSEDGAPLVDYDLGIDFLPVVHVPNSPAGTGHFGTSSLTRVLQILDDLQNADTDAEKAASTTGSPIIVVSGPGLGGRDNPLTGTKGTAAEVAPGEVWPVGENGGAEVIDTSTQLAATRDYVKHLQDRLSVNSRLPASVLGMVKPSEVPSGFAMQLSFGPLSSMVRTMRAIRTVKYRLMLKMVMRLYQANGGLPPGATPTADLHFGPYLPADLAAVLELVTTGVEGGVLSLETGITMLLEAGFPVDDVAEEIERIRLRDFTGAGELVDVTGDANDGRRHLGMDPVEEPPPAPPIIINPGGLPPANPNDPAPAPDPTGGA